MVTKVVELNRDTFTKLDTGTGTAIDMQTIDDSVVTVVFATSQPAPTTRGFIARTERGVVRNGHTGDMWAILGGGRFSADVVVGE
jgi:hypothetical protein